ncbi:hypothetical protein [Microbacterium flavum]|uniref:Uncharacterized protein n=1 Tax=Microbacterium flavum TaxID=415216 RepID=A0ABS5XW19_9MICO|nr:hypothetical protein [Microbacterium flavum]MBT8798735.1 hypothetical protein [Microbacterium flavum]
MTDYVPSLIAVVGTLLGATLAFVFQSRLSTRQATQARKDRQREDYVAAATELASAVSTLIQAEYNRAKLRFTGVEGERREEARRDVYDKRTATRGAAFRLQLVGSPAEDRSLVVATEELIMLCRAISTDTPTHADAKARKRAANAALEALIGDAHRRINRL